MQPGGDVNGCHLAAELRRLDALIRPAVACARRGSSPADQFRGLYVSDADLDALLVDDSIDAVPAEEMAHFSTRIAQAERELAAVIEESVRSNDRPRLLRIQTIFGLDTFEKDCLLICLAPELDLKYERIYAYLQDDVTKRWPSVDLILKLLAPGAKERNVWRDRFAPEGNLFRGELLETDPETARSPLLGRRLRVEARISAYLQGSDSIDDRLRFAVRKVSGEPPLGLPGSIAEFPDRVGAFLDRRGRQRGAVVYLQGRRGSGAQDVAAALCARRGLALLTADLDRVSASPELFHLTMPRLYREAFLQPAALLLYDLDSVRSEERRPIVRALADSLRDQQRLVFISGEAPWAAAELSGPNAFLWLNLGVPDAPERIRLWSAALNGGASGPPLDLREIAGKFRFTAGQIQDAAQRAADLAAWNGAPVCMQDLHEACRMRSNQRLGALARKIQAGQSWGDIVLPPDRVEQLREICNHVRYRDLVYREWGFDRKLSYGKGLTALFAGPSGTGKTMAAGIMAAELGLDLYKIDLSTVVSKYIGETEKNLARIFSEAESSNAILFFDEADALFGKRSEVRDSHDRYANIETSYLLQRMEEYEGVAILATNFRRNMDEAFVRRLQFTVEFPLPNCADRLRIWRTIWPDATPRAADLDLESIAGRYEISGGHIRNIALAAAFMAADDSERVEMSHVMRAVRREFQKMGKIVAEGDFAAPAPLPAT